MKKMITLLLVLTGMVTTAKATWYVSGPSGITNSTSDWGSQDDNIMTDLGDNIYQLVVVGKSLTKDTSYEYKINDGSNWYGWGSSKSDNAYFSVHVTGTYTITYKFDASTNNVFEAEALLTSDPGVYLHSNKYWANNDAYKFSNTDGTFSLDVDVADVNETFYYRFTLDGWTNDFGAYGGNANLDNGILTGYEINLNDGNFYKEDSKDHNFCLPLSTKPCAKLNLTLRFINHKVIMNMQCSEKVTTNGSGYCTFVSNYPLTISDATAYVATDGGSGSATATAITNPAASTPMLIKGDPSTTYYFAVAASGTDYSSTNAFKPGTSTTETDGLASTAGGKYNYILNGNTFYKANGKKVAVGKAYLQLTAEATGRALIFDDEDVTGINTVTSATTTDTEAYYNLAGQRIDKPTKGLYIVGGKKVIVK